MSQPLRVAAINFLNPAPLMWNFEHGPTAAELATRYTLHRMTPSDCARALANGRADIGLVPIGAYAMMPELTLLPGCAIASLDAIRSILLVVRTDAEQHTGWLANPDTEQEPEMCAPAHAELVRIGSVALDMASRSSAMYTKLLFARYWRRSVRYLQHAANLDGMLQKADAALLIGDPALHALRDRAARYQRTGQPLRYIDMGHIWHAATGSAWVSAAWAIRTDVLTALDEGERAQVIADFTQSGIVGVQHTAELSEEWAPRLKLSPEILRRYLGHNIYYRLDAPVVAGIERFFTEIHEQKLIRQLPRLRWA